METPEAAKAVADFIVPTIAKITLTGDQVDEIIVIDSLFDVINEALKTAALPDEFPDQQGVTRERLAEDFREFCASITVRTANVDQLAIPDTDEVSEFMQFIRPITKKMKHQAFLEQWDRSIGFTETIRSMGCPFEFSVEEKRMLYGIAGLLNAISLNSNRQMQTSMAPEIYGEK